LTTALVLLQCTFQVTAQGCTTLASFPDPSALPNITVLPDPWTFFDGTTRVNSTTWPCRKAELLSLIQHYFYGEYPSTTPKVTATRSGSTLSISVTDNGKTAAFSAALSLPSGAGPFPVLISLEAVPNPSVYTSVGIAVASFSTSTVAADSTSKTGAFWTLYAGQDVGVLLAWAWGVHRIIDALELFPTTFDVNNIGVTGCSRWGKGALAAGIFDERVKVTVAMSSGQEGIAPLRFQFGAPGTMELLSNSVGGFPWWTRSTVAQFANAPGRLPWDAHLLAALVAPRPIVWDEGHDDTWTNPEGTVAVTFPAARLIFNWLGVGENVGVNVRAGGHCAAEGYPDTLPFVREHLQGVPSTVNYSSLGGFSDHPETRPWANNIPA